MRSVSRASLTAAALLIFAAGAHAVDLVGYYEFENNDLDSSGAANDGIQVGSAGFGAAFRGVASRDLTGGQINLPINANPSVNNQISFGGWVNADLTGQRGFMATDNGGWDRGIEQGNAGNLWGIASGGQTSSAAAVTQGSWQYVVGTFNKAANRATLYVGNDVAGTQTTTSVTRADAASGASEVVIELGRYDARVFDGRADDIFVFQGELTPDQANAVRNLRLNPTLDYSPVDAELLFDLFDAATGSVSIGDIEWVVGNVTPGTPGQLSDLGGGDFELVLNSGATVNNGLIGSIAAVPEPSTIAIWLILGLVGVGFGWRNRRRR